MGYLRKNFWSNLENGKDKYIKELQETVTPSSVPTLLFRKSQEVVLRSSSLFFFYPLFSSREWVRGSAMCVSVCMGG